MLLVYIQPKSMHVVYFGNPVWRHMTHAAAIHIKLQIADLLRVPLHCTVPVLAYGSQHLMLQNISECGCKVAVAKRQNLCSAYDNAHAHAS